MATSTCQSAVPHEPADRVLSCLVLDRAVALLTVVICIGTAPALYGDTPQITISGDVAYVGLNALPWHSTVYIYLRDISSPSKPGLVAEQTIVTEDQQIPISFSLTVSRAAVRAVGTYAICADIRVLARPAFQCDKPFVFQGKKLPKRVRLILRRAP